MTLRNYLAMGAVALSLAACTTDVVKRDYAPASGYDVVYRCPTSLDPDSRLLIGYLDPKKNIFSGPAIQLLASADLIHNQRNITHWELTIPSWGLGKTRLTSLDNLLELELTLGKECPRE